MAESYDVCMFNFLGNCQRVALFYIPTKKSLPAPPYPWHGRLFRFSRSVWCVVLSHCGSSLSFLHGLGCWAYFHEFICHWYVFFGKKCVQIFFPFLKWGFLFPIINFQEFFIYSKFKNLLSNTWCTNILSQSLIRFSFS